MGSEMCIRDSGKTRCRIIKKVDGVYYKYKVKGNGNEIRIVEYKSFTQGNPNNYKFVE